MVRDSDILPVNDSIENDQVEKKLDIKNVIFKYLSYWPYFVLSIGICFFVATIKIRYSTALYNVSVRFLISDKSALLENNDIVGRAVFGSRNINLDNELQFIKSRQLIERVVLKKNLNIFYYANGRIKQIEYFENQPVSFIPLEISDSSRYYSFKIVSPNANGAFFEFSENIKKPFKWDDTLQIDGLRFLLHKNVPVLTLPKDGSLTVQWVPIREAANQILGSVNVNAYGAGTSIISLLIATQTPNRAVKVLNSIVEEFIAADIEKKKENSTQIINFIDKRLSILNRNLDSMQQEMIAFKRQGIFLSVESEYNYYNTKVLTKENSIEEAEFNLILADYLENYIRSGNYPASNKIIPIPLVPDGAVAASINRYNDIQNNRDRTALNNKEGSLVLKDIDRDLKNALSDIYLTIKNYRKLVNFKISEDDRKRSNNLAKQRTMPEKQLMYEEMVRQKNLKQNSINYLIQRKEQQEIIAISTRSNYEKMDPATYSNIPFEPKSSQIRMTSILLGFTIPVLIIFLIDFFNEKITTKEDITNNTSLPIVGEISHADEGSGEIIVKNSRDIVAEQFRVLRTNLEYLGSSGGDHKLGKTILVTSSLSGEGKSFISLNLASILALTGKKVALLEFDLRKLQSIKIESIDRSKKGITNYLINQVQDPVELINTIGDFPSLHIFNTGSLPPNPAELIISEKTTELINWLKKNYEYIIMDSAPVGPVSDSFALAKHSDIVLYVLRQLYTHKKQVELINELHRSKKLKNMSLIVNDVKISGRYGYYGYSGKYGNGYYYGYGGYNYYGTKKRKKRFNFFNK